MLIYVRHAVVAAAFMGGLCVLPACSVGPPPGAPKQDASSSPVATVASTTPVQPSDATSGSAKLSYGTPPEQRRIYRLDFTISTTEAGKSPVSTSHTMNLESSMRGEIRVGSNVPLTVTAPRPASSSTASFPGPSTMAPRQDIGLAIHGVFSPVGDDLLINVDVEMSALEENMAIRKMVVRGDALVSPGTAAIVGRTEDPTSHKRLEVTVSATRLR